MNARRRRRPNARFWILLTVLVVVIAGAVTLHSRHHHRLTAPQNQQNNAASTSSSPPTKPKAPAFSLGQWSVAPITLTQPIVGFAAATTPHAVWLLGGLVNGNSTTLVQKVTWSSSGRLLPIQAVTPGLPVALHDEAAVALSHHILLLGGGTNTSTPAVFQLPLPHLSPATSVSPLPIALSDEAAIVDGSKVLVVGGHNTGNPSNTIWAYAPGKSATVWSHLKTGVRYPAVAASGKKLYVVGGLAANGRTSQALSYNLANGQMTPLPPYPISVDHAQATVINHRLVVAGGQTQAGWISAVYWYDAAKKSWKPGPALPEPGGDGAFVTLPTGVGAWFGGNSPSGAMDAVWTIKSANTR